MTITLDADGIYRARDAQGRVIATSSLAEARQSPRFQRAVVAVLVGLQGREKEGEAA